jgi:hypothetical protein
MLSEHAASKEPSFKKPSIRKSVTQSRASIRKSANFIGGKQLPRANLRQDPDPCYSFQPHSTYQDSKHWHTGKCMCVSL